MEENQGKLRGVQDNNGSIVALPPHGERPRDSHATDPGGRRRRRGSGEIRGVLPMSVEVSGVSGGWVTGKGTQTGKNQRAFNVPALEGKNRDPTGGTNAYTMVRPLWDAHSSGTDVETQEDRHMR